MAEEDLASPAWWGVLLNNATEFLQDGRGIHSFDIKTFLPYHSLFIFKKSTCLIWQPVLRRLEGVSVKALKAVAKAVWQLLRASSGLAMSTMRRISLIRFD